MSTNNNLEVATFGGGCFWCTEAVFKRIKGVKEIISGYSGGIVEQPTYEQVSKGITKHAEAVQLKFNPDEISYEDLLEIFWNTHDPTTLNKQGADIGTQYRSVIFYHNNSQKEIAIKSKQKQSANFKQPIVTEILPFEKFYTAEEYHQNFYEYNKESPYCSIVITPKIQKLLDKFNDKVKDEYK